MSFKRAGDDHCALRIQKKQRVAQLLGEDVPQDEARKTRSGKFVCLICPHQPVLDTMATLVLHRQGKKHLANVSIKVEKEHNLSELLQKRQQEEYLRQATSSINTSTNNKAKNHCGSFPGRETSKDGGPLLERTRELTDSIIKKQSHHNNSVLAEAFLQDRTSSCEPLSKRSKPFFQSRIKIDLSDNIGVEKVGATTSVRNLLSSSYSKSEKETCTSKGEQGVSKGLGQLSHAEGLTSLLPNLASSSHSQSTEGGVTATVTTRTSKGGKGVSTEVGPRTQGEGSVVKMSRTEDFSKKRKERLSKEQQEYMQMKMDGWVVDHRTGSWIKDENVEFDSDDEDGDQ